MHSAATAPINAPQSMEVEQRVNLRPRNAIKRDVERYVLQAGDLLPDVTKRNWKGMQGYQLGGQVFDLTEVPALWKFSGWVSRGRITPLIKKPTQAFQAEEIVKKKQEQVAEIVSQSGEAQEVPNVYRMSWPWDSLQTLLSEHNGRKGMVEVGVLEGVPWDERIVQGLQALVFPNWADIETGRASLPFKVADFVRLIESRRNISAEGFYQAVIDAYLESADKFKVYAESIVQMTRDLARRGANDRGYVMGISPISRHLAAQIGETIDSVQPVVIAGGNAPAGKSQEEIDLMRRQIEAAERANTLKAKELGLIDEAPAPPKGQSMQSEAAEVEVETVEEIEAATDAIRASAEPGAVEEIEVEEEIDTSNMTATGAAESKKKKK